MKKNLIKVLITIGLVLVLTVSAFAVLGWFDLTGYNSNTVNSVMAGKNLSQIYSYMASNFTWKANLLYTPSPYTVYATKKGDCNDFATYGGYCAYKVGGYSKVHIRFISVYSSKGAHGLVMYGTKCGSNTALYPSYYSPRSACEYWAARQGATLYYAKTYDYDMNYTGRIDW